METLEHAFFECRSNQGTGDFLLQGIRKFIPNLSQADVLRINFESSEELNFPIVWFIGSFLSTLWQIRQENKRVELFKIRAELEAQVNLLRESRLVETKRFISTIFS